MAPLTQLGDHGQSVWLDYIRRDLVREGGLARLVADGVRGVTSNPSIFEKAIGDSDEYDEALSRALAADATATPLALFEAIAVTDIQEACDVLRAVYDETGGHDGFVSLEVSPTLAHDSEATIKDARRLWKAVDRPNLMIKVPATPEGIPAIEELIAEGINVNVTLMFSLDHYEAVAQAYLRGLRRAEHPEGVASVASFFVSRVDSKVDAALDELGSDDAKRLRGSIAIANSKLAYRRYQEIFEGETFADLADRGARPQRVLWASTSTKDPEYRDVLYVEELVGDNTVNTVPPDTLELFEDHGIVRPDAVTEGVDHAASALATLDDLGIDFDRVTEELQTEGVTKFADSFEAMLATIDEKSQRLLAESVDEQALTLGSLHGLVEGRLKTWADDDMVPRMWAGDHTVWMDELRPELTDRLGWLTLPETMREHLDDIRWFVDEVRSDGITDVVLAGMGGSSLAPEVFSEIFGAGSDHPRLHVLDSTHPDAVTAVSDAIDATTTLFIVASKSGTTIEPLSFLEFFWDRASEALDAPGRHFVAITDPGTPLVDLAAERSFRKVFTTIPDVGGRYSALTHFGLVPAALVGADIGRLLDRATRMAASARLDPAENPAVALGAALGELAREGRDKATFLTSASLAALPDWFEQLIAESTGKEGTGIVPIAGERAAHPDTYGDDRFFVYLSYTGDDDTAQAAAVDALEAAGHPVARIEVDDLADVASEMFRGEVAVAAAGAVLRVHPFDQPDVQRAKQLAQQAMRGELDAEPIPEVGAEDVDAVRAALGPFLEQADAGAYVAFCAFLSPTPDVEAKLQRIRQAVGRGGQLATTLGFGPRFLHSTGQLHKGGPPTGVFVQLVDHASRDVPVPTKGYTFGELIAGQADGDHQALTDAGRRVIRICLGDDVDGGLDRILAAIDA